MSAVTNSKRTTITEIANRAGVSIGLVSSFLTGREYRVKKKAGIRIAPATAEHIRKVCREMKYWPDKPTAFNRIYPEFAEICLLSPKTDVAYQGNQYFSLILNGILDAAMDAGTKTSIAYFDPDLDYENQSDLLPLPVFDPGVEKFLLSKQPNDSLIRELIRRRKHIVYMSRRVPFPEVASVVPDYRQAARIALTSLVAMGHRKIGLVASRFFNDTYNANELREGVREVAGELGLTFSEKDLFPEHAPIPSTLDRLFSGSSKPTALFGFDDHSAGEAMLVLRERGFSIPGDVSVIGCNDEKQASYFDPPLTTIHIRTHQLGSLSVELVNRMMQAPQESFERHLVLPVYLVERATTCPPST